MRCRLVASSVLGDAVVPGEGFEPPKAKPADLQSAPFDRLGIPANRTARLVGAR